MKTHSDPRQHRRQGTAGLHDVQGTTRHTTIDCRRQFPQLWPRHASSLLDETPRKISGRATARDHFPA